MKITRRFTIVLLLSSCLVSNPILLAGGNPVPGRWEKVSITKLGTPIRIYTKDGVEHKCRFESIDDKFLTCTSGDDDRIQVKLGTIDEVTIYKRGKYINWGGVLGVVGGVVAGVVIAAREPGSEGESLFVIYGSAIGLVAGSLTGAAIGSPETIYISKEAALRKMQQ